MTAVTNEANARIAGDATLTTRIAAEENARAAADLALGTRVTGVEGRVGALETRVSLLEDYTASSTAIAVALGGATFLPDSKFNISTNFGFYDGASAGALQLNALVSENVAVSAGVATGFNKGGQTAGRVGLTFGW